MSSPRLIHSWAPLLNLFNIVARWPCHLNVEIERVRNRSRYSAFEMRQILSGEAEFKMMSAFEKSVPDWHSPHVVHMESMRQVVFCCSDQHIECVSKLLIRLQTSSSSEYLNRCIRFITLNNSYIRVYTQSYSFTKDLDVCERSKPVAISSTPDS